MPVDPGAAQVEEGAEGEGHRRVLARRVGDLARRGDDAGQRDHVDHVAAAGLAIIRSSAATVPFIVPIALTSSIVRRVASSCSQEAPVTSTPALLTQRSSEPPREIAAAAAARQASSSRTSSAERGRAGADRLRGPRGRVRVDVGGEHDEAATGQLDRDRPAQAASRSGDHGCRHRLRRIFDAIATRRPRRRSGLRLGSGYHR